MDNLLREEMGRGRRRHAGRQARVETQDSGRQEEERETVRKKIITKLAMEATVKEGGGQGYHQ